MKIIPKTMIALKKNKFTKIISRIIWFQIKESINIKKKIKIIYMSKKIKNINTKIE